MTFSNRQVRQKNVKPGQLNYCLVTDKLLILKFTEYTTGKSYGNIAYKKIIA